jgi:uncharacterized membrane protein
VRTDRGLDRLITFLDAIVAIAITLLVLPLVDVLPDMEAVVDLDDLLAQTGPRFAAFTLSFAVIARFWLVHHRLVEQVGSYDRTFVLINLLWALTIVLLPFATEVAGVYGNDRLAITIYVGTMTLSSACLTLLTLLLRYRPQLRRPGSDDELEPAAALAATGLLLVALVVAVALPRVGYLALLLLALTDPARRLVARQSR